MQPQDFLDTNSFTLISANARSWKCCLLFCMLCFLNFSDIEWGELRYLWLRSPLFCSFQKHLWKKITLATAMEKSDHLLILLIPFPNTELWCECIFGELCLLSSSTGSDSGFITEKNGVSWSLNYGLMKTYDYNHIKVFGVNLYHLMLTGNLKSPETFQ